MGYRLNLVQLPRNKSAGAVSGYDGTAVPLSREALEYLVFGATIAVLNLVPGYLKGREFELKCVKDSPAPVRPPTGDGVRPWSDSVRAHGRTGTRAHGHATSFLFSKVQQFKVPFKKLPVRSLTHRLLYFWSRG